jgi:hypothetical protein
MAFDELKTQSYTDYVGENIDLMDEVHDSIVDKNSSGLMPILTEVTDLCSDLYVKIDEFVQLHNSLKDNDPNLDVICDAGFAFHKIAYMLSECIQCLNENIDTSWYHSNDILPVEIETNSNNENIE